MAEFTPITTQEAFDEAIAGRLERERKKYADYDELKKKVSEHESVVNGYESKINELNAQLKNHATAAVKMRLGYEKGLPMELINRINGETEEEIAADVEALAKFATPVAPMVQPLFNPESAGNDKNAALKELAADLFK